MLQCSLCLFPIQPLGTVSAVASASLSVLLSRYASITPLAWFGIFCLLMIVCWSILGKLVKQDLNLSLKYQATRKEKAKYDWKEINMKDGKKRFKTVKYLIMALTTLYVPVTRNSLQMLTCAPKYAYSQWQCVENVTNGVISTQDSPSAGHLFYGAPQELQDPMSCVDHYLYRIDR